MMPEGERRRKEKAGMLMFSVAASLLAVLSTSGSWVEAQSQSPSNEAMETVIRNYILKHPEVIEESLQALEQRRAAEEKQRVRDLIIARSKELLQDPDAPVGGNPQGDVTLVEFFDYRCRFCKAVAPTVSKLLAEDANVRLIYKDFPILGEASHYAARAALASRNQGKYQAFHEALMSVDEELTEKVVIKIAKRVGINVANLKADMKAPQISSAIEQNRELAKALGINGTPAFIVGSELTRGAMDLSTFKELMAKTRSQ
jgi:protein-disulfide isomerase